MILDANLRCEALSALLGTKITSLDGGNALKAAPVLSVGGFFQRLIPGNTTRSTCSNPFVSIKFHPSTKEEFFIDEKEFFDPGYDFDFTNLSDSAACKRGDEPYERPKGWYRMALKVKGKYSDGDAWLGTIGWRSDSVPGEWPVSYHGTGLEGQRGITSRHYKPGPREVYGRGIYSTPKLNEAETYCETFTSKSGKKYKVTMQNRINPEKRQIHGNYWLIPVPAGTSADEEKRIAESSIRPYGVLIKEVED